MELIEQPELKATYDKCKYRVKLWEHNFKKQNGRLPSKFDIREAEKEVRFAYKMYFELKSAAIERSFVDIDGFQSDDEDKVIKEEPAVGFQSDDKDKVIKEEPAVGFQSDDEDKVIKAVEESNSKDNEDLDSEIWGSHLNNKVEENKKTDSKSNVNASFSQKLFGGSKFSKRNPRKSLSLHSRKSQSNLNCSKSLSQPMSENMTESFLDCLSISSSQDFMVKFSEMNANNVKVVSTKSEFLSQPIDLIQSVLNNDYKLKTSLDTGWIDRVSKKTGADSSEFENNPDNFSLSKTFTELNKKSETYDYDSDDIIANSEDEFLECDTHHISKKMKIDFTRSNSSISEVIRARKSSSALKETEVIVDEPLKCIESNAKPFENVVNVDSHKLTIITNTEKLITHSGADERLKNDSPEMNKIKDKTKHKKNTSNIKEHVNKNTKKVKPVTRRSSRAKRVVLKESSDSDKSDDSDKDAEYSEDINTAKKNHEKTNAKSSRQRKSIKTKGRSPKAKNNPETTDDKPSRQRTSTVKTKSIGPKDQDEEQEEYELEYSVKPRILTVPRITNIKKVIRKQKQNKKVEEDTKEVREDKDKPKSKMAMAKEKLEKKIASGNLNENYVTINIKKKVFVRGKKTMNFSKYKKQMWKNKKKALSGPDMDMGGCDGGVLTCFNCGDVGHFARRCPQNKGNKLLPLDVAEGEDDEECPFPSLEEAEKMAQESALAVRKSNKKFIDKRTGEAEVEESNQLEGDAVNSNDEEEHDSEDDLLLAETVKLEEYVAKLDMKEYIDSTTVVKPYYELNEDGTIIDTPKELYETLDKFGYSNFRAGQERAIMRILSGKSTLVTLSTGSGKSLCYQLPAYMYSKREPCIALIISPLVSLMEDQVTGLPPFLKAACLHTNQTKTQRERVMEEVLSGALSILLVSPEAVAAGERSSGFGSLLRKLPPISFACIDEAHCVSQWSHNFRPSYLMICRILRERLGVTTILGLTATATVSTANNIVEHLQITDGAEGIISDIPLPDNLRLTVSNDASRDNALLGLLLSERFAKCKSVIVYCTRREVCERVATFLRMSFKEEHQMRGGTGKKRKRMSVEAEPYHAGLSASRRKSIQKSFMSGELRIVVATVAFGMGINKSDIRSVIHYNMPGNFESYVQEIGRAGRDGLPAHCHLFLDFEGNDENELRRHVHANSIDRHVIRKLLQKIFVPCSCKIACPKHEVAFSIQGTVQALDVPEENIATLLCYLELHDDRFVQVLSPAYTICKIISYRGSAEIRKVAKDCPPLAMALALHGNQENEENIFEFPVVDVASAMGWDSGICKHKLKNLEWITVNNLPKRSSLSVEFLNLGFRLLAPGNLIDDQLDQTLDYLYKRVVDQEKMCLTQLRALHVTLTSVVARTYKDCLSEEITEHESQLKEKIREYFHSPNPLAEYEVKPKPICKEQIVSDTRQLITMYRDNSFTGRAVARIFHGIQSPNYPALIWGRCKFWRAHLKDDFHEICKIATGEILKMR